MKQTFLLTAGGTGGHLFPAQALAGELQRRGHVVDLATDERADKYGASFPARDVHIIQSATVKGRSPLALMRTGWSLLKGVLQARGLIKRIRPAVVVGFGGYPTFPPMFAARLTGTPSVLHEANGVMGRANKMLASNVRVIATSSPIEGLERKIASKCIQTGNPVRDMVIEAAKTPYPALSADGEFHLLVFGGSQGARVFSNVVPEALGLLSEDLRQRLQLVQQCRPEDLERVRGRYQELGIRAELASFFTDMPARISASHLVICRSGASSVSELTVIGRPSILVPLPNSLDQDQLVNATTLESFGGALTMREPELTAEVMARELERLMGSPDILNGIASAAKAQGKADAVSHLADLVEQVAQGKDMFKGDGV